MTETKKFVIRTKIQQPIYKEVPKSTYTSPRHPTRQPLPPIKPDPFSEELSKKQKKEIVCPPTPPFQLTINPPPNYGSVDVRTNTTEIQREIYVMNKLKAEAEKEKSEKTTKF